MIRNSNIVFPKAFKKLIENFSALPSIGPKMAERLVLYLFKQDNAQLAEFAENLLSIKKLGFCRRCFNIAENDLCEICRNDGRNPKIICVVEEPLDIISIEKTRAFNGIYHVLGGVISLNREVMPLKINELVKRATQEKIEEIIIATNPTTEGDATALYLKNQLKNLPVKITRLGRGLSTGGDIEYADEITLSSALSNRKEIK
ncbi:MAG: recombination protein RecR [Candidatus Moranbacteria bacterium CG06_land_8_20_14_3_00_40_12]|nr:MAG: recombination protein RecR [Candidatus Moranbacteria bacterium CG23_combo_of_CG06-09_8_20_14_all_40_16]PIU80837.1 MAG: recombination protein RecR [Candidatus Moranbacteria bacterium CG06_land_8_20_14_3_00_40_12]